jgi:hypothetical protein
LMFNTLD